MMGADGSGMGAVGYDVAVVVIAAADGRRLPATLDSVSWAKTRMLVDLDDKREEPETLAACAGLGVSKVPLPSLGEDVARSGADWVLLLEGHEQVSPALRTEIGQVVGAAGSGKGSGYRIGRRVAFLGRTLRSRVWSADWRVRLAPAAAVDWERFTFGSLPGVEAGPLLREPLSAEPYASLHHFVIRMDLLTDGVARTQMARRKPVRGRDLFLPSLGYVLRALPGAATRDGVNGVLLAMLEAYGLAVACAKRWELERSPRAIWPGT